MKITQSFDSPVDNVNLINDIKASPLNSNQKTGSSTLVPPPIDQVTISYQGDINQKIDSLFDKADAIYQSHITPTQQKTLDESYQKLDVLFAGNDPTEQEQNAANALFDKIDSIFTQAEKQLTPKEKEQLVNIDEKLDKLLGTDSTQNESVFSKESDLLLQKSEDLLTSKLSTQQKKTLDELNLQLNTLFESVNFDDKEVSTIFDKIDSILNKGYDKLSGDEKQKLETFDKKIDLLFETLDSTENEGQYY